MKDRTSTEVPLDFILPHKLFATMYDSLLKVFQSSVLGGMAGHPILRSRPDLRTRGDLNKVVL